MVLLRVVQVKVVCFDDTRTMERQIDVAWPTAGRMLAHRKRITLVPRLLGVHGELLLVQAHGTVLGEQDRKIRATRSSRATHPASIVLNSVRT